jgi:hypothetical protein
MEKETGLSSVGNKSNPLVLFWDMFSNNINFDEKYTFADGVKGPQKGHFLISEL